MGIVLDALDFTRNADGIDVQFGVAGIESYGRVRCKPDGCFHALAVFLERLEVQIFLPGKCSESHLSLPLCCSTLFRCVALHRGHRHKGQALACPLRYAMFTSRDYFARAYVTSSVNASFWSLRKVQVVLK